MSPRRRAFVLIWSPKSAESRWPLIGISRRWRLEWWTTTGAPGRFIAIGPVFFRWGAA